MPTPQAYIKAGRIGALIAAICCFTPLLVILLGVIGLGAVTGYLGYLLLPALLICLGLLAYGIFIQKRERTASCDQKNASERGRR
ncbi:MAG TPA: mercury resistance system transport protein MerF [Candidatus Manganitrophaceae bacterium]|nr:mercury resistance system transport protein MerF [Candidatus Manganitrophaceae bacterium]